MGAGNTGMAARAPKARLRAMGNPKAKARAKAGTAKRRAAGRRAPKGMKAETAVKRAEWAATPARKTPGKAAPMKNDLPVGMKRSGTGMAPVIPWVLVLAWTAVSGSGAKPYEY